MLSALYRHGAPPSMGALAALLEKEAEQRHLMEHMAFVGWSIGKFLYRDQYIQSYTDMTTKVTDTRTGAQIVDDLAARFRKRIENREKARGEP